MSNCMSLGTGSTPQPQPPLPVALLSILYIGTQFAQSLWLAQTPANLAVSLFDNSSKPT